MKSAIGWPSEIGYGLQTILLSYAMLASLLNESMIDFVKGER